ncbi:right-handed parallel beta-helix repeat-containing protein [Natrarchaeobius oligotrophus]|uniref:Right handed beta helix domain-containing protein n=1 Tax=Natrarchaeobius chitinivorans TaxID=1679083 RepID=A0A3N6MDN2_NATCH|nr:right-handed parallel beta-helix repeat-containing protein [Natrarchaeobius chitinivorans]RQH01979.1 hypothetical protein EA472_06690 [Natrarchaeobius chitinivorans]
MLVKNTGTSPIDVDSAVDVLVDGEYVSDRNVTIAGDSTATNWRPGATARITVERELEPGTHRVVVRVASNEAALEFEVPVVDEPADVSYVADPENETVDDGETITYDVTVTDGFGDPVDGVEVEADATDGFDVDIDGDGDVTTGTTGSDGTVTFDVSSDTSQEDVDVAFTELVNDHSATGQATWEGEQEDGTLSGTVTTSTEDGEDEDLEGEEVTIESSPTRTTTIEDDGTYDFGSVEGGEYAFRIDADGHRTYETTIIVDDETTKDASLAGNVENVDAGTGFTSLAAAADDVGDGETLELAAATYDESGGAAAVAVDAADVTVRSLGDRDETVLDAGGADAGLAVTGDEVSVDGLTVQNVDSSGIGVSLESVVESRLENVAVVGAGTGVDVSGSEQVEFEGIDVSANGDGVRVSGSQIVTLRESSVSDNAGGGIVVTDTTDVTVSDSIVSDNGGDGVRIVDGDTISVDYSRFANNDADGMQFRDTRYVEVVYSEMVENGGNGVLVQADEETIDPSVEYYRIWFNDVADNDEYGMWAEDSDKPDGGNDDLGGGELVVDDERINGEENWWGDEDGPEAEGANGVSGETVRYEPFADEEISQAGTR